MCVPVIVAMIASVTVHSCKHHNNSMQALQAIMVIFEKIAIITIISSSTIIASNVVLYRRGKTKEYISVIERTRRTVPCCVFQKCVSPNLSTRGGIFSWNITNIYSLGKTFFLFLQKVRVWKYWTFLFIHFVFTCTQKLLILLCRNDDSGESEKRGVLGPISVQQSVFPLSAAGSGGAALRQTLNELLPLVGVQWTNPWYWSSWNEWTAAIGRYAEVQAAMDPPEIVRHGLNDMYQGLLLADLVWKRSCHWPPAVYPTESGFILFSSWPLK